MSGVGTFAVGRRVGRGSRGHANTRRPMATAARLVASGQSMTIFDHLRSACVELLKVHQEDGEAVGGEHMVVEGRRARRVHVWRDDQAGAREGRTGRGEREDRYREKAAHF